MNHSIIDIPIATRQLYPDEQRLLKTLLRKKQKEIKERPRYHYFPIALVLSVGFVFLADYTSIGFLKAVSGTLAIFCLAFLVMMPFEMKKGKKKLKNFVSEVEQFLEKGIVNTRMVTASRIALAEEFEDESDLYIIEYGSDKILYLWDTDFNLRKSFPCLHFEIYDDKFYQLFGRQIYSRSARVSPVLIDKKAKWKYMSEVGWPSHLETENKSFDEVIEAYNRFL